MERRTLEENRENKRDYAVLVGLRSPVLREDNADEESLAELAALVETAGGQAVGTILQSREKPDPHSFIGEGKVEEVRRMVQEEEATMVIFDNDLSPSQIRVLTEMTGVQVLDRSGLILDIFAQRAKTKEGCLQVELAQYQYLLPRLVGMWTHLERQAGTSGKGPIGSKGPGETQLETDRRHIHRKIDKLKAELEEVRRVRSTQRQRRQKNEIPVVAIVGYTNAGKSSIMNALVGLDKEQYEQNELFATLDATTKAVKLVEDFTVSLTDTVGFIQNLPTELIKAFKSTLEESANVDLLIHVVDASNPHHEIHEQTVLKIMEDLKLTNIPVLNVYNKMDIAPSDFLPTLSPSLQLSIKSESGVQWLKTAILEKLHELFDAFELELPYEKAYQLPELRKSALVQSVVEGEEGYLIKGLIAPELSWKLPNN